MFEQHNAFRAPGAATIHQLRARPTKVDYFASIYANMHMGIIPHPEYVTPKNIDMLAEHNMVFICIDASDANEPIITALEEFDIPFIDVGMGLEIVDDRLIGTLRTTTSTPGHRDHVRERARIPMQAVPVNDLYALNIQVADLNALNATFAVIRWKKLWSFYTDSEGEHFSLFTLNDNHILNEDSA